MPAITPDSRCRRFTALDTALAINFGLVSSLSLTVTKYLRRNLPPFIRQKSLIWHISFKEKLLKFFKYTREKSALICLVSVFFYFFINTNRYKCTFWRCTLFNCATSYYLTNIWI